MKRRQTVPVERERQETPSELVADLMGAVRGQFYGDLPARRWFQDQHLIKRWVVLWPAAWLDSRGVTLPAGRYKEILLGIFHTIKGHGDTARVEFWPRYLATCVQSHFRVRGEDYYNEGKSLRLAIDRAVGRAAMPAQAPLDPVRILAETARVVAAGQRRKKPSKPTSQPLLFDL